MISNNMHVKKSSLNPRRRYEKEIRLLRVLKVLVYKHLVTMLKIVMNEISEILTKNIFLVFPLLNEYNTYFSSITKWINLWAPVQTSMIPQHFGATFQHFSLYKMLLTTQFGY